ncbi:MAG: hypothetical protein ACHQRM_16345 [Bacteroidia bacterium]
MTRKVVNILSPESLIFCQPFEHLLFIAVDYRQRFILDTQGVFINTKEGAYLIHIQSGTPTETKRMNAVH